MGCALLVTYACFVAVGVSEETRSTTRTSTSARRARTGSRPWSSRAIVEHDGCAALRPAHAVGGVPLQLSWLLVKRRGGPATWLGFVLTVPLCSPPARCCGGPATWCARRGAVAGTASPWAGHRFRRCRAAGPEGADRDRCTARDHRRTRDLRARAGVGARAPGRARLRRLHGSARGVRRSRRDAGARPAADVVPPGDLGPRAAPAAACGAADRSLPRHEGRAAVATTQPAVVTVHDLAVYAHPDTFACAAVHFRLFVPPSVARARFVIADSSTPAPT